MRKVFLAGIAAVCMLMMGMTAFAAEPAVSRRVRAHGGCHQQTESFLRDGVRHDCTYADADGDGICDSCGWHQDRHHCVDEDGYCLNSACNYENCGYGHGTGYCRGYCNSLAAGVGAAVSSEGISAGMAPTDSVPEGREPENQGSAGMEPGTGGLAGMESGNGGLAGTEPGNQNAAGGTAEYTAPANAVPESGGAGYYGYGCHGGGHHGNGHHGCR